MKNEMFKSLKCEVNYFLSESSKDRLPAPILRIGEIILAIRKYKAKIIEANAPRGFVPGSESDGTERQKLREHRLACLNNDAGVKPQMEWLMSRDREFVLEGETWRIQDAIWQIKVWTPLFHWVHRGFALMYEGMEESNDSPKCHGLSVLQGWEDDELEIEWQLILRKKDFLPDGEWPIADLENGLLRWAGREAGFQLRELQIINLLVKKKGRFVGNEAIRQAVGDNLMEPDAIRQMFSRLNAKLKKLGFAAIAASIERTKEGRTRLDHDKLMRFLGKN